MSRRPGHWFDPARVAAVVIEAKAARLPAAKTVARMLNVSHNQARYMIRIAQEQQLLGTDKHRPAPAIVNRSSVYEYHWVCCIHCLVPWPCPTWRSLKARQNGAGSN